MNKEILISKHLEYLFGRKAAIIDVVLILVIAIVCVILIAKDKDLETTLSLFKFTLLQFVAFDIGGEVIANFTKGTSKFYSDNKTRRLKYIALHVLQPVLLYYIFPSEMLLIIVVSLFAIISSIFVSSLKNIARQRVTAIFLLIIGIGILSAMKINVEVLYILLLLYMIKLILGFSVRHYSSK